MGPEQELTCSATSAMGEGFGSTTRCFSQTISGICVSPGKPAKRLIGRTAIRSGHHRASATASIVCAASVGFSTAVSLSWRPLGGAVAARPNDVNPAMAKRRAALFQRSAAASEADAPAQAIAALIRCSDLTLAAAWVTNALSGVCWRCSFHRPYATGRPSNKTR